MMKDELSEIKAELAEIKKILFWIWISTIVLCFLNDQRRIPRT